MIHIRSVVDITFFSILIAYVTGVMLVIFTFIYFTTRQTLSPHARSINEFFFKLYWRFNRRKISPELIVRQRNAIYAEILFNYLGIEKYMESFNLPSYRMWLASDDYGTLYRIIFNDRAVSACFVKVKNSTAEPDGTFKYYYIRVPPVVYSPKGAIAWTFGLSPAEYNPQVET